MEKPKQKVFDSSNNRSLNLTLMYILYICIYLTENLLYIIYLGSLQYRQILLEAISNQLHNNQWNNQLEQYCLVFDDVSYAYAAIKIENPMNFVFNNHYCSLWFLLS